MTRYKKLILKEFLVKFLHTDGDIRTLKMNAFDLENARGRFEVNWCKDMKILNIIQNKSINVEKREIDISYSKDKMFTTCYPESRDGEEVWRTMAEKMDGAATVFNFEAKAIIKQIRDSGYIVKKAIKTTGTIDQILKELTEDES